MTELEVIFSLDMVDAPKMWREIAIILKNNVQPDGKKLPLGHFARKPRLEAIYFDFETKNYKCNFCPIPNWEHAFLTIESKEPETPIPWDTWMDSLNQKVDFLHARTLYLDYEYWQNAEDPRSYTIKGKSYDHLPMKSNESPPPLERTIIDISNNPGRRIIRMGYVEAIGAVMWLGPKFWDVVGSDKKALYAADWIDIQELPNEGVRIQVAPDYFKDDSNRELQDKLRAILFPKQS